MRRIVLIHLVMAVILGLGVRADVLAADFYFVTDAANPNQLQCATGYQYFDFHTFQTVANFVTSAVGTDSEECDPSVSNDMVADSSDASTAVAGFGGTRISWSGEGILGDTTYQSYRNYVAAVLGLSPDVGSHTSSQMTVDGYIASDLHANGTPCTVSGELSLQWQLTGRIADLDGRHAYLTVSVNGYDIALQLSADSSGGTVIKTAPGIISNPISVNPSTDATSVSFSVAAHVGDRIAITASSSNALENPSGLPGNTDNDSQTFTINVDVQ